MVVRLWTIILLGATLGLAVCGINHKLDRNLFEVPASEISNTRVTMTIFDGRTVYE